jgi:hypothetical protein
VEIEKLAELLRHVRWENVASGLLLLLFSATIVSWELLVSVAERKLD